ncbi:MAG: hypothetical protein ACREQW_11310 [Candidatus Binatia bacterium]
MNRHALFYYPYGSFQDKQAPLLKAAALYFDKLYILDPEKASGGTIGAVTVVDDVRLLEREGILERIAPEEIVRQYESALAAAIEADLKDREFLQLCQASGKAQFWTLALAKVPRAIRDNPQHQEHAARKPQDQAMQRLMGDLPGRLAGYTVQDREPYEHFDETETVAIIEQAARFARQKPEIKIYDETQPSKDQIIEYRYADYPLSLGESIMINHALFAGLLHTKATPVTDDLFHSQVLRLKMKRARQIPDISQILEDRATRQNLLVLSTLTDRQLKLPAISARVALEDILQYRHAHATELQHARDRFGWLARQMEETPWSRDFESELEHKMIPQIAEELEKVKQARDSWLKSKRGGIALKAAGIAAGAAATTLSFILDPTPLLPVVLGLAGSTTFPAIELALDWKQGKKEAMRNGLHYLLKFEGP